MGAHQTKTCKVCGTLFNKGLKLSKKQWEKYVTCSRKCGDIFRSNKEHRNCIVCNATFEVTKNSLKKLCSKECVSIHQKTKENILCAVCGEAIKRKQNIKYCGKRCASIGSSILKKEDKIEKKCKTCNKIFYIHKYRVGSSLFCSKGCHYNFHRKEFKCKQCGRISILPINRLKNKEFCSRECSNDYQINHSQSFSKGELELYYLLKKDFPNLKKGKGFKLMGDWVFVDMLLGNVIIEYFGDYWHCNPFVYNEGYYHKQKKLYASEIWLNDLIRIQRIGKENYLVLVVWEWEWKNKRDEIIEKCKDVLRLPFTFSYFPTDGYKDVSQTRLLKKRETYLQEELKDSSRVYFNEVDSLDETDRGGFGSTGKN